MSEKYQVATGRQFLKNTMKQCLLEKMLPRLKLLYDSSQLSRYSRNNRVWGPSSFLISHKLHWLKSKIIFLANIATLFKSKTMTNVTKFQALSSRILLISFNVTQILPNLLGIWTQDRHTFFLNLVLAPQPPTQSLCSEFSSLTTAVSPWFTSLFPLLLLLAYFIYQCYC